ncbi:Epimerase domain-containing protein [Trichostrongylus colubriformis]|uniref:Epimerase domain-containing protein n=1 Tax=Trichostrongylus colubriformis TaxID=6319 RepID=A0AAN8FJQ7_TRICO
MIVTVLGANSLIGQHLVRYVQDTADSSIELITWTYADDFEPRLPGIKVFPINHFTGLATLREAVERSDIVFNLHEVQDMSLSPDEHNLWLHNVEFVGSLLSCIRCPLIHLSSVFVQCSSRWPNVYEGEADPLRYSNQWPFPRYCSSKYEAEEMIRKGPVNAYVVRCVPAYGEGDRCSVLTDLIKVAGSGDIVSIGDLDGIIQMAYAGNLADGLWKAALHLLSSVEQANKVLEIEANKEKLEALEKKKFIKDTVILADETPKKNVFVLFKSLLTTGKRNMTHCSIPFAPVFYIYYLFTLLINMLSVLFTMPLWIQTLPHPSFLYLNFHHWTFFNTNKSRLVLNFCPSIDYEDALNRCQMHYRRLQPQDIPAYSWRLNRF